MLMDAEDSALPVVGTVASAYAHTSMDELYARVAEMLQLPHLSGQVPDLGQVGGRRFFLALLLAVVSHLATIPWASVMGIVVFAG